MARIEINNMFYVRFLFFILCFIASYWIFHKLSENSKQKDLDNRLASICELRIISNSQLEESKLLLEQGADPNQKNKLDSLLVNLMTSWQLYNDQNHEKLFLELLNHGADPNGVIPGETDPLILWGFVMDLNKALIEHGACLDARTRDGQKAYDILLKNKRTDIIDFYNEFSLTKQRGDK